MAATLTSRKRSSQSDSGRRTEAIPGQRGHTDADAALFGFLDHEAHDYIDHPLFQQTDAEAILFGERPVSTGARSGAAKPVAGTTLTRAQETLLFQRYNYARKRAHESMSAHTQGMTEDERCELLKWAQRAVNARDQLAEINHPLVLAMLRRTHTEGGDFDDLISEGSLALFNAIRKFNCSRGFKFSTYACSAILKSYSRAAMKMSRRRQVISCTYDPRMGHDECTHDGRTEAGGVSVDELRGILARNHAQLSDLEQTIIRERYAVGTACPPARPKTLNEVGLMVGLTKERVRQIQNRALYKIRGALEEVLV